MNTVYYLLEGEERTGPYTFNEVIRRELDVHTQVATSAEGEWVYASELPEFYRYFESRGIYFPTGDNLASFGLRVLAFLIDYFPLYILIERVEVGMGLVSIPADYKFGDPLPPGILTLYVSFLGIFLVYKTLCEFISSKGTLGKRACKLVVVDIDGKKPTLLTCLMRNVGVILSITLWIPFLSMLISEHKQNWYDSLAKTYVLKTNSQVLY